MKKIFLILFAVIALSIHSIYPQLKNELRKNLDEYMTRLTELGYSGALLVAKEGEVIFSRGYGLANRTEQTPVTPETIFTTGSVTKQFTAAAILKLEMQGKLNVQEPITKYFKNVPEDKKEITLHHLLTHSAGLKSALGSDFAEISRDEYIELAMKTPLNRPPGETYEYSNVGFSLLAAIVEQVSGQSYDAFLQEHLFNPAGMENTGYPKSNWNPKKLAHGYQGDKDWGTFLEHKMAEDGPYWHLRGNGGVHSTTGDMYKWHLALQEDKILSKEAKEKMYTPHIREGESPSYYGYGWSVMDTRNGKLITHNGGNPYFAADFLRYVDRDVTIYITSNSAEQRAFRISRTIAKIAFGEDYTLPPLKVETLSEADLQKTEMGRHALAFLELLGAKDDDSARNLIKEHYSARVLEKASVEKQLRALQPDRDEIGAVEIGEIVTSDKNSLELTVRSEQTGQWWLLDLIFEKASPYRIDGIGIMDTEPPTFSKLD